MKIGWSALPNATCRKMGLKGTFRELVTGAFLKDLERRCQRKEEGLCAIPVRRHGPIGPQGANARVTEDAALELLTAGKSTPGRLVVPLHSPESTVNAALHKIIFRTIIYNLLLCKWGWGYSPLSQKYECKFFVNFI